MSKVWYSLCETYTFWFSMGLEGGFVKFMGLFDQIFDVESVVFIMRDIYIFWLSMGLEGGFVMGLLDQTFDVESVVFFVRDSHFLGIYGAGWKSCYGFVGSNFRCRKCGIPYARLTFSGFLWVWREDLLWICLIKLSMVHQWTCGRENSGPQDGPRQPPPLPKEASRTVSEWFLLGF